MEIDYNKLINSYLGMQKEKQPLSLFHYTDNFGLKGILENNDLHLTDFSFLNDPNELLSGLETTLETTVGWYQEYNKKIIRELRKGNDVDENSKYLFLDKINEKLFNLFKHKQYLNFNIFSFSQKSDSLAQWKGYTDNGKGYCIGFDYNILKQILQYSPITVLSKVIYEEIEKRNCIERFANSFFSKDEIFYDNLVGDKIFFNEITDMYAFYFFMIMIFFKSEDFQEEEEWRLVLFKTLDVEGIHKSVLKTSRFGLSCYIDLELNNKDILNEIIIGPKFKNDMNTKALSIIKDEKGYKYNISESKYTLQ